jgi:predicted permease
MQSVTGTFAEALGDRVITIEGRDEFVSAEFVSGAYYPALGVTPVAGRLLDPSDDVQAPPVLAAAINERFWERRFGRRRSAIGTTVTIDGRVFTIVGVAPKSFLSVSAGYAPDITFPVVPTMREEVRVEITNNWLNVLGRLRPGATVEQANAEAQTLWRLLLASQAASVPDAKERSAILQQRVAVTASPTGVNEFSVNFARPLTILMVTVALVLALSSVNLSGLLVARAAARRREISIRLAIGAGRSRIVRQLLAESLVLAALGSALGFVLATWLGARLMALFVNGRDLVLPVTPDWRVFAFTAIIGVVASLVTGLAPALYAVRFDVSPALKETRIQGRHWLGRSLVVAQLAISMVLVVGAALFLRTLANLYSVERGFDDRGVLVVQARSSHPYESARGIAVREAILERLRRLPGVERVSAAQVLPVSGGLWNRTVQIEGYTVGPDEAASVGFNVIAPAYFATLGTPLVHGREFDERDTATASKAAIVNERFARHFFGDASALGRGVTSAGVTYEIVGVVRDARYQTLRDPIINTVYIPWLQREGDQPTRYQYLARTSLHDPLSLAPVAERVLRDVDPSLHVRATLAYSTLIERSIATERIMAMLAGLFGVIALLLAAIGLFGLLAFQVSRRTNEFGIRKALGATDRVLIGVVLRDVASLAAVGIAIGVAGSLALAGLVRSMLFGLTPTDPSVFTTAATTLAVTVLIAGWLPARRAARVDPLAALRQD